MSSQAFVEHEVGEAARTIATVLHFIAIRVEDAVIEFHVGSRRGFDQQQLVEADAGMAVGQATDLGAGQHDGIRNQVDDHEVVAEAVHFGKR